MADYLSICKDFRSKAGIAGTGPVAVTGQVGEYQRIVTWVREAWVKIQTLPYDWTWMWAEYTPFETIASTSDYVLTNVDVIHTDSITLFKTSVGPSAKYRVRYEDWKGFQLKFGAVTSDDGTPTVVTRMPSGGLRFYPAPDVPYTVGFEYQTDAQVLTANADTPAIPSQYHDIILYRALLDYAGYEETTDVYSYANSEYTSLLRSLQAKYKLVRAGQWVVRPQ